MEFFCAQKCCADFVAGTIDFTARFPLTENEIDQLVKFLNIVMTTQRSPQARFSLTTGSKEVRDFFSDMLISNNKVNEFGQFLISSRVTVWGYRFFEQNEKLEKLIEP